MTTGLLVQSTSPLLCPRDALDTAAHPPASACRFNTNPLVTGPPHLRFYAGAPLMGSDGSVYGEGQERGSGTQQAFFPADTSGVPLVANSACSPPLPMPGMLYIADRKPRHFAAEQLSILGGFAEVR